MEQNESTQSMADKSLVPSHQGEGLPLVVWLKGDEPFFDEFYLDAEDAMAFLDIKRTRLSQISGREVRVGRVKSGRYIVPRYRKVDLVAYLEHTRAPATHQKAALLSEKIENTLDVWDKRLSAQMETLLQEIEKSVGTVILGEGDKTRTYVYEYIKAVNSSLHRELFKTNQEVRSWINKHFSISDDKTSTMSLQIRDVISRLCKIETSMALIPEIHKLGLDLQTRYKSIERELSKNQEELLKLLAYIEKNVLCTKQPSKNPALMGAEYQNLGRINKTLQRFKDNPARKGSLRPNPPR